VPPSGLLRRLAGLALALLQRLHAVAQRLERSFLRRELRGFIRELFLDFAHGVGHRRRQAPRLGLEPGPALGEAGRDPAAIVALGFGNPDRLLERGDPLLQLAARGRRARDGILEGRQRRGRLALGPGRGLARGQRRFDGGLGLRTLQGQRGVLSPQRAQLLGQSRELLRQSRLALAREREFCSSRVTSALAA